MKKKFKVAFVDTITNAQIMDYMTAEKKKQLDDWMDYGKDIFTLLQFFKSRGFIPILLVGKVGSGKTMGIRNFSDGEVCWFNMDEKDPTWRQGFKIFGPYNKPKKPKQLTPKSYNDLAKNVDKLLEMDRFEETRFVILSGHIDTYKDVNSTVSERLFTMGKVATKFNIEGNLNMVIYSRIVEDLDEIEYKFQVMGTSTDTCRTYHEMFTGKYIDNDLKLVIDTYMEYMNTV